MKSAITIIIFFIVSVLQAYSQNMNEKAFAVLDKKCYIVGEQLHVGVQVVDSCNSPSISKVAYIEVADTKKMYAQTMIALEHGKGWADIPLPANMHSGCFQVCVYTRAMRNQGQDTFYRTIIGVVNPSRVSAYDNILFLPADSLNRKNKATISSSAKETISIDIPEAKDALSCFISVYSDDINMNDVKELPRLPKSSMYATEYTAELEGHTVLAQGKFSQDEAEQVQLAMVGKESYISDGQRHAGGSYTFFTSNIFGKRPIVLSAYSTDGKPLDIQIESPYAHILPTWLPRLTVYCNENDLRAHNQSALREQAYTEHIERDTTAGTEKFTQVSPDITYDLDEWTRLSTIREMIVEYLHGIDRKEHSGVNQLFVFIPEIKRYSDNPALVLLDGMPIHNIDDILDYDAHLLKYVYIYSGRFTFGSTICNGVVSFVTAKGRLSNYKLDSGSRLMAYSFPQDHPQFFNCHSKEAYGTMLWKSITGNDTTIETPGTAGRYNIVISGVDKSGKPFRYEKKLIVQ